MAQHARRWSPQEVWNVNEALQWTHHRTTDHHRPLDNTAVHQTPLKVHRPRLHSSIPIHTSHHSSTTAIHTSHPGPSQPSHTFAFCSPLVDCFPLRWTGGGFSFRSLRCTSLHIRTLSMERRSKQRRSPTIHSCSKKIRLPNQFPQTITEIETVRAHYPQIIIHRYSAERGSQCQLNSLHSSSRRQFP